MDNYPSKIFQSERTKGLRSEAQYKADLAAKEKQLLGLLEELDAKIEDGFIYLSHTCDPVVGLDELAYLPEGSATYEERQQLGLERLIHEAQLIKGYGRGNVWLGPQASNNPVFPQLSEFEQRGYWVRDFEDAILRIEKASHYTATEDDKN